VDFYHGVESVLRSSAPNEQRHYTKGRRAAAMVILPNIWDGWRDEDTAVIIAFRAYAVAPAGFLTEPVVARSETGHSPSSA